MPEPIEGYLNDLRKPFRFASRVYLIAAAAGDYAAADAISQSVTDTTGRPVYVPNLALEPGGVAGIAAIRCVCVATTGLVVAALRNFFFTRMPLPAEVEMDDNVAFVINAALAVESILAGVVLQNGFVDRGAVSVSDTTGLQEPMQCAPGQTGLWMLPTFEAAEANESVNMVFRWDFYTF